MSVEFKIFTVMSKYLNSKTDQIDGMWRIDTFHCHLRRRHHRRLGPHHQRGDGRNLLYQRGPPRQSKRFPEMIKCLNLNTAVTGYLKKHRVFRNNNVYSC